MSTAEAALESHVEQRLQSNPPTSHSARQWLQERRAAIRALADAGIDLAVVATYSNLNLWRLVRRTWPTRGTFPAGLFLDGEEVGFATLDDDDAIAVRMGHFMKAVAEVADDPQRL
jgi:hypothetical protein